MKPYVIILLCGIWCNWLKGQYYYRGDILDDKNQLIANANIIVGGTKALVAAGSSGSFGVMSPRNKVDTFTFITEDYEKVSFPVYIDKYNIIKLKLLPHLANLRKNRLTTAIKNMSLEQQRVNSVSSETYSQLIENEFVQANDFPSTGFAINSDKASYSNIRRFINTNSPVPTSAVRIDEMVNYFGFATEHPNDSTTFNISSQITQCPWNQKNYLLFLNVTAKKIDLSQVPPSSLVFLIDNSGSMELQNRMELLKSAFKALIKNLRPIDKIAIITYGGGVATLCEGLTGADKDSLLKVIDKMEPGGDTPGENAIRTAYQKAKLHFVEEGNNRIVIATDGDFNVGIADEEELERLIVSQSKAGVYLTCLGLGMGNYKDSKLAVLAKKGKGNFAYLDSEQEAEQVMVKELTQTLYSVADDAYMNMEFKNKLVSSYRLIGYDNKLAALTDSSSRLEGGQVGSGYSSLILFEIEPSVNLNPEELEKELGTSLGTFSISYINPKTQMEEKVEDTCMFNFKPLLSLPSHYGFASAVAMFGGYVKESKFIRDIKIDDIRRLAAKNHNVSSLLQTEFLALLDKAENIYEPNAKKKRKKAGGTSQVSY